MREYSNPIGVAESVLVEKGWAAYAEGTQLSATAEVCKFTASVKVEHVPEMGMLYLEYGYHIDGLQESSFVTTLKYPRLINRLNCYLPFGSFMFGEETKLLSFFDPYPVEEAPDRVVKMHVEKFLQTSIDLYQVFSPLFAFISQTGKYPNEEYIKLALTRPAGEYMN